MGNAGSSALCQAAARGDLPALKAVADRTEINGRDPDGWSALHYSAWLGHDEVVRELLIRGAEPNVRDGDLRTPLHLAVLNNHEQVVVSLCDHGAIVNAADQDGLTALHKATAQNNLTLVGELIARGADVNARLQDGTTPTHLAAWQGNLQILVYLLDNGADVEAANLTGQTPLHEAAGEGHESCARKLLAKGASRVKLDSASRTPADLAQLNNHTGLAALLTPQPGELEAHLARQKRATQPQPAPPSAPSAAPSAPVWQSSPPQPSGRVPYPVISPPEAPTQEEPQISDVSQPAGRMRYGLPPSEQENDWEPKPDDDDWEGIPSVPTAPAQGTNRIDNFGRASEQGETAGGGEPNWPLSALPGPVQWMAGAMGGLLSGWNPWAPRPADSNTAEHDTAGQAQAGEGGSLAEQQEQLEEREAEVAAMSALPMRSHLDARQLEKLRRQEAEIAELRQRLAVARGGAPAADTVPESSTHQNKYALFEGGELPSLPVSSAQAVTGAAPTQDVAEARVPQNDVEAQPVCRVLGVEQLSAATDGFAAENLLGGGHSSQVFKGGLEGTPVAVKVPRRRDAVPTAALRAGADKLAGLHAQGVVPLLGVARDGSAVFDLMQRGSVEDALRSRPPSRGSAPVRLDWKTRCRVAAQTAQGLHNLHTASPGLLHGSLKPAKVLLSDTLEARLLPPSLHSMFFNSLAHVQQSSHQAPEVRRGEAPTPASDVYSLGIFLLQLLTGSEAAGLLQYVQDAVSQGRLTNVMDPCADGITQQHALPLARLALRCVEEHASDRPNLEMDILPALERLSQQVQETIATPSATEPASLIVCPITQEVMDDPVVAADGFTYERSSIQEWLDRGNERSPMTNKPLTHRQLTPNFVVRSAARQWQEQHPTQANKPAERPLQEDELDLPSVPTDWAPRWAAGASSAAETAGPEPMME